jgi:Zn-dependent peptidase ImmA (M78 family)
VPVPVERIIKARNIVLQYAPLDQDLSGMAYIKDGVGIIGVNALHHPNRQRFSAAHELAHHELHADEIQKAVHVDKTFRVLLRDDVSSQGIDPLEIDANAFAAELLMPREFLMNALDAGGLDLEDDAGIEALARKFRVSASAMRYRLAGRFQE